MKEKLKERSNKKLDEEKKTPSDPEVARAEEIRGAAGRETVEAFVVAFILALLFRGFVAEAFVIPTGSMAPTLMGAHKDLRCDKCGMDFQVGASLERRSYKQVDTVVGGICPNCRHTNALDLVDDGNHATFNGDRILVSKFSYCLADPKRWDVIVFKFPGNPKQAYIKRLVGLPNETLTIRHGDVYVRPTGSNESSIIVRKPPDKILAMRHRVSDSDFQSEALIKSNYPCRWQAWEKDAASPPQDSWQVQRSADGLVAELKTTDQSTPHWLRYFHRWPDRQQWNSADDGQGLESVDPYSCHLVTDFYAYDSYQQVVSDYVYDTVPVRVARPIPFVTGQYTRGVFSPDYKSGESLEQFGRMRGGKSSSSSGVHWVGDLIFEADIETESDSSELTLLLVEAGVNHQCKFDLETGKATLSIAGKEAYGFLAADGSVSPTRVAQTDVRAGSRHEVRFANVDDQLVLWVDDGVVEFDGPTTFDARSFLEPADIRPRYSTSDPQDGAPVGIAVTGGQATVRHLRVDRDKYYIATRNQGDLWDYNPALAGEFLNAGALENERRMIAVMGMPNMWEEISQVWQSRREVEFVMEEDQFFPMGDNSPESLDARCWAGTKLRFGGLPERISKNAYRFSDAWYVPRDLLVGKALLVFWPHGWNEPFPLPNFKRFGLIR